ncbi:MAG: hypothetical protein IJU58_02805 [Clostridia bacterium]|nr:hypothetical protein [Clostridia bacterium]
MFSLALCAFFGVISEIMLSHTNILLATILLLCLVGVSVLFDMIGVAVTASDIKPFLLKSSTNLKEINIAIRLIKNADKVNSVCADVVGDVCSILSGAAGATICVILLSHEVGISSFVLSILLSSLIASINVLGKAIGKTYAMINANKIVLKVSKIIGFFVRNKNRK